MDNILIWTEADLTNYLTTTCCGKEWESYGGSKYTVFQTIRDLFDEDIQQKLQFKDGQGYGQNDFSVRYDGIAMLYVSLHKKMTQRGRDSRWSYIPTKYEISTIEISWMDGRNLGTVLEDAKRRAADAQDWELLKKKRAIEILRYVMDKYKIDKYEARTLCSYVDKQFYSLDDYLTDKKTFPN